MPSIRFTADISLCPLRLDIYASTVQNISRSRLKTGLRLISVNGKAAKLSLRLKGGEEVFIEWEDPLPEFIEPQNIPLDILFENEDVTVVNKAQGMVTHPGAGNRSATLVNALLYHWGSAEKLGEAAFRTGIVHRLDKDTSGVLIAAKNREAEVFLQTEFKKRRVKKEYIAIVQGHPPSLYGEIKNHIARSPSNRKKFAVSKNPETGKSAYTVYRCIGIYGPYSLMRIQIKTGRTHQIRVHMKHLGCPVLGDPLYGKKDALFTDASLMLHARRLGIRLPYIKTEENSGALKTGKRDLQTFKAPVPLRFKKVLKTLHTEFEATVLPENTEKVLYD
ncbi:RluA family pseudouridine synthase [Treponema sp. HNW]|uniref:RluA family pseudouridine synthase n=1 Tax=Treponema sp. HNW TaxID=3116654 RepID=UPI003D0B1FE4